MSRKLKAWAAASFAAGIVTALGMALLTGAVEILHYQRVDGETARVVFKIFTTIFLSTFPLAALLVLVIGLPGEWAMRRMKWQRPRHIALAGVLCWGALSFVLPMWLQEGPLSDVLVAERLLLSGLIACATAAAIFSFYGVLRRKPVLAEAT